eukprot:gene10549-387_t
MGAALCPPLCCCVTVAGARLWCHAPLPWGAPAPPAPPPHAAVLSADPIPPSGLGVSAEAEAPCVASFPGRYAA